MEETKPLIQFNCLELTSLDFKGGICQPIKCFITNQLFEEESVNAGDEQININSFKSPILSPVK